jgi:hypothetical protein
MCMCMCVCGQGHAHAHETMHMRPCTWINTRHGSTIRSPHVAHASLQGMPCPEPELAGVCIVQDMHMSWTHVRIVCAWCAHGVRMVCAWCAHGGRHTCVVDACVDCVVHYANGMSDDHLCALSVLLCVH